MATLASDFRRDTSAAVNDSHSVSDQAAWAAVIARDRTLDGRFVTGVLTTGIYCRPSCAARHPKRENVRFFATGDEARQGRVDHLPRREPAGPIAVEQPGDRVGDVVAHAPSDASSADEWATAPNTPPCIVTIFNAAW